MEACFHHQVFSKFIRLLVLAVKQIRVGICGLGTVGGGTLRVIQQNGTDIDARTRSEVRVVHVGARNPKPDYDLTGIQVSKDIFDVVKDPNVDLVVETIGGMEPAKSLVLEAIANGKDVVTANKALIAVHGNELFEAAEKSGVTIAFEAAVAGAIPVIRSLRDGLSGNQINELAGIINGTGNFILTEMRDHGRAYEDVLKEAQELGYAEADPTFDVEGIDAAHKLCILASIAYGIPLSFDEVYTEGISKIQKTDVVFAQELGYRIKHLGIAKQTESGIELRVHPTLIPETVLLASVEGVMNAVWVDGNAAGPTLYYGAGAGALPTASSIVSDIVEIARNRQSGAGALIPPLGVDIANQKNVPLLPINECKTAFYLSITAKDEPGVMLAITQVLTEAGVSIDAIIQKEAEGDSIHVPIALITSTALESVLQSAVEKIESLDDIVEPVVRFRVEDLEA